ncbi:MAG TPA: hypothetical protein VHA78_04665 [Candidatus Peribacteraceae bacterium]|nr:hypothetical protein [Candidatus Peribacteraceae bacterium]
MIEQPDHSADQSCTPSNICEVQNGMHRFMFRIPDDKAGQARLMNTAIQYANDPDVPFAFVHAQIVITGVHRFQAETGKHIAACVQLTGDRGQTLRS